LGATEKYEVDTPCTAYTNMSKEWELIDDLLGGTDRMREKTTRWLPIEPKEQPVAYSNRLNRSFLYGAYEDTAEKIVSKPFSKPVTVTVDGMPAMLDVIRANADNDGRNLTHFASEVFTDALHHGISHIFVDLPAETVTNEDELRGTKNPYFAHIKAKDVIGWRGGSVNGETRLLQVRIKGSRMEPDGLFGERRIDYVRVYQADTVDGPGFWQIWEKPEDAREYFIAEEGEYRRPFISMVTFYTNRTGFMTAKPPLKKLAEMNLAHWQSYSDYRNYVRFASIGKYFGKGLPEKIVQAGLIVGVNDALLTTNTEADLKIVEASGAAAGIAREAISDLVIWMEILGLQPFIKQGNQTATGQRIDENKRQSTIQTWAGSLSNVIADAYKMAEELIGSKSVQLPADFSVRVFDDIGITVEKTEDVKSLIMLKETNNITRVTLLKEIQRRALLSDDINVEDEAEAAEAEADYMPPREPGEGLADDDEE